MHPSMAITLAANSIYNPFYMGYISNIVFLEMWKLYIESIKK